MLSRAFAFGASMSLRRPGSSSICGSAAGGGRMTSTDASVVSGGGRFDDPWHPFDETSAALTAEFRGRGYAVEVSDEADASLASPKRVRAECSSRVGSPPDSRSK
jgi:hypothetical protein